MNEETVRGPLEHPVGRLDRYGIEWQGPEMPVCVSRGDGYWTPWHVAQAEIDSLRAENERLREALSGAVTVLDSLRTYGLAKYDCAQSRSGSLVYVAPTIDEAKALLTPNT